MSYFRVLITVVLFTYSVLCAAVTTPMKLNDKLFFIEKKGDLPFKAYLTALPSKKSSLYESDVAYLCSNGRLTGQPKDKVYLLQFDCAKSIQKLFKEEAVNFKGDADFVRNQQQVDQYASSLEKTVTNVSNVNILKSEEANDVVSASLGKIKTINIKKLFSLEYDGVALYDGAMAFSVEGCDQINVSAKSNEITAKAMTLVERIKQEQAFSGQVSCEINTKTGELKFISNSRSSHQTTFEVKAAYTLASATEASSFEVNEVTVNFVKAYSSSTVCPSWGCQYFASFNIGAEGASVGDVSSETIVRYEFSTYSQVNSALHAFGRVYQSASSVAVPLDAATTSECPGTGADTFNAVCKLEVTEAINAEVGLNYFFYESSNGGESNSKVKSSQKLDAGALLIGPTVQYGVYKADEGDKDFRGSYYWGIRFAYSKLQYFDFLVGEKESVLVPIAGVLNTFERKKKEHYRFRGQLPVQNAKFITGVEIDLAQDKSDRFGDSIKIFVTYQVDFGAFFK